MSPRSKALALYSVGVDAAKLGAQRGWVAVVLADGAFSSARWHASFEDLYAAYPRARCFGVDIPIGLVERGVRGAEAAAKAALRSRYSSVFPVPPRSVLEAADYSRACSLSQRLQGKKISKQTWALRRRILELDAWKEDQRVREVHPEVSFTVLAGGEPLESKQTWGGQMTRRRLLREAGIDLPDELEQVARIPANDILDAAVAAWSARRILLGKARSFPDPPIARDGKRSIAIWA